VYTKKGEQEKLMSTRKNEDSDSSVTDEQPCTLFTCSLRLLLYTGKALELDIDWYAEISASPNPVGVGQRVLIIAGFSMRHDQLWRQLRRYGR